MELYLKGPAMADGGGHQMGCSLSHDEVEGGSLNSEGQLSYETWTGVTRDPNGELRLLADLRGVGLSFLGS